MEPTGEQKLAGKRKNDKNKEGDKAKRSKSGDENVANRTNYNFNSLPPDMIGEIVSHLSFKERFRFGSTTKAVNKVVNEYGGFAKIKDYRKWNIFEFDTEKWGLEKALEWTLAVLDDLHLQASHPEDIDESERYDQETIESTLKHVDIAIKNIKERVKDHAPPAAIKLPRETPQKIINEYDEYQNNYILMTEFLENKSVLNYLNSGLMWSDPDLKSSSE